MNKNTKKIIFLFFLTLTSFFITGCNGAFQYGFFKSIGALIVALVPIIASFTCWGINSSDENEKTPAGYWCGYSIALTCVLFLIPFFYSPTDGFWFRVALHSTVASIFVGVFNPLRKSINGYSSFEGFPPFLLSWGYAITTMFVSIFVEHFLLQLAGWVILGIILGIYSSKVGAYFNKEQKKLDENRRKEDNERIQKLQKKVATLTNRRNADENKLKNEDKKNLTSNDSEKYKIDENLSELEIIKNISIYDFINNDAKKTIETNRQDFNIEIENQNEFFKLMNYVEDIILKSIEKETFNKSKFTFEVGYDDSVENLINLSNLKKAWLDGNVKIIMENKSQIITFERKTKFCKNCLLFVYKSKNSTDDAFSFLFYHNKELSQISIEKDYSYETLKVTNTSKLDVSFDPLIGIAKTEYQKMPNIDFALNLTTLVGAILAVAYDNLKKDIEAEKQKKDEAELAKAKKEFDDTLKEMIEGDFLLPLTLLPTGNYNIDMNEADFIGNFLAFKMIFNLDDSKWLEDATYSFEVDDNIPLGALKNLQNLKNLWLNGYLRIVAKSETKKFIAEKKNTVKTKDKTYKFKGDCFHIVYEDKDTPYFNSDMFFHSDLEKGEGTMALTVAGSLSFVRILLNKPWIFNIFNFLATLKSRYPKVQDISMNIGAFISLIMSECYETLKNIDEVELPKSISFKENNNAEERYKALVSAKSQKTTGNENIPQNSATPKKITTYYGEGKSMTSEEIEEFKKTLPTWRLLEKDNERSVLLYEEIMVTVKDLISHDVKTVFKNPKICVHNKRCFLASGDGRFALYNNYDDERHLLGFSFDGKFISIEEPVCKRSFMNREDGIIPNGYEYMPDDPAVNIIFSHDKISENLHLYTHSSYDTYDSLYPKGFRAALWDFNHNLKNYLSVYQKKVEDKAKQDMKDEVKNLFNSSRTNL